MDINFELSRDDLQEMNNLLALWSLRLIKLLDSYNAENVPSWLYLNPIPKNLMDTLVLSLNLKDPETYRNVNDSVKSRDSPPFHIEKKVARTEYYLGDIGLKKFFSKLNEYLISHFRNQSKSSVNANSKWYADCPLFSFGSIVRAVANSESNQSLHSDDGNSKNGIVIGILLCDVDEHNGPTEFITPPLDDEFRLINSIELTEGNGNKPPCDFFPATGRLGSAFAYTSKTIHRGHCNSTFVDRDVLFLVFEPYNHLCRNMEYRNSQKYLIMHGPLRSNLSQTFMTSDEIELYNIKFSKLKAIQLIKMYGRNTKCLCNDVHCTESRMFIFEKE